MIDLVRYRAGGSDGYYSYPHVEPQAYDPAGGGGGGIGASMYSLPAGAATCHWGFDGDALADGLPALQACYAAARVGDEPKPAGRIVVESLANSSGVVSSARTYPELGDTFATCVNDAARSIHIPRNPDEEDLYQAYRESAEYAEREMGETMGVPEPPVRPIVCGVHASAADASPSVAIELTPTSVLVDGEEVVDITLLQDTTWGADFDKALSWLSAAVPAEYLVPEANWSLALRAHPAIDSDLVDLVLSYLEPTSVYFARGVGTSDDWQVVNPLGTPGWGFCTVHEEEFTVGISIRADGRIYIEDDNGGDSIEANDNGGADLPGLRRALGELKALHGGRTDAIVRAPESVAYRSLVNVIEVAVAAGFVDTAFWAASYPEIQQEQDARMVDP